ncbi:MAG: glycosyl transferase family protein [Alphaproteobacteria bacterium]|nr:glycosyl transferase family protein [Alphaproteobacteria bacterium]
MPNPPPNSMTDTDAFAPFVRILGRGPGKSRALTRDEARDAMTLILEDRVAPEQLGAFLMLMRYRRETAEELAGFVEAARALSPPLPEGAPDVDLDWPSYADRHKQLPWFVLSALLLAKNGVTIAMHGIAGQEEDCAPTTRAALAHLGVTPCASLEDAAARLAREPLVYLPLENFAPQLEALFALRPLFSLRSPVNSFARALNPLGARAHMTGVFHPDFRDLHRDTSRLTGQACAGVFKGGGGEAQRNPLKPCLVVTVHDGVDGEEEWPALAQGKAYDWRGEAYDAARLSALWKGELENPVATAAVTGSAALALKLLGRAKTVSEADAMAQRMWAERPPLH